MYLIDKQSDNNVTGGYHGITFQKYSNSVDAGAHTWNNWKLIPTSRPVVAQPQFVQKYVDIPGRDGSLDMTDFLVGRPTYTDRTGTWEFYATDYDSGLWESRRAEIAKYLDGSRMKVTLDDDKYTYYDGRVVLREWKSEAKISKVVLEYRLKPYKYDNNKTSEGTGVL